MSNHDVTFGSVVPMHNPDAEKAVIGLMLTSSKSIYDAKEILAPESFFIKEYRYYFRVICDLSNDNKQIDFITVAEELNRRGEATSETAALLSEIQTEAPVADNVKYHALIVQKYHLQRKNTSMLYKYLNMSQSLMSDPFKLIEEVSNEFSKASGSLNSHNDYTPAKTKQAMLKFYGDIKAGRINAIPTGFAELDAIIGGLISPDFVVIAARTQIGKTSLAMSMVHYMSIMGGYKTGIFSLEMPPVQLAAMKLMAYYTEHPVEDWRLGVPTQDAVVAAKRERFFDKYAQKHIYMHDCSRLSDKEFYNHAKKMKLKYDVDVIFVDYIQLMHSDARMREEQLSNVSKTMKETAKELNIPIVGIAQLNREADKFEDAEPKVNQIRYSGAIEQDADIIILIERPMAYRRTRFGGDKGPKAILDKDNHLAKLHVKKNRLGPNNSCYVKFNCKLGMYMPLEIGEREDAQLDLNYDEPDTHYQKEQTYDYPF